MQWNAETERFGLVVCDLADPASYLRQPSFFLLTFLLSCGPLLFPFQLLQKILLEGPLAWDSWVLLLLCLPA